jgi:hypothetical protein
MFIPSTYLIIEGLEDRVWRHYGIFSISRTFEDTKEVVRSTLEEINGKMKNWKNTNNGQYNTSLKNKDWAKRLI